MKQIKDGWHNFYGSDVYVENGKVMRGMGKNVYRLNKDGGWDNDNGLTVAAYRAAHKRGTIALF